MDHYTLADADGCVLATGSYAAVLALIDGVVVEITGDARRWDLVTSLGARFVIEATDPPVYLLLDGRLVEFVASDWLVD